MYIRNRVDAFSAVSVNLDESMGGGIQRWSRKSGRSKNFGKRNGKELAGLE